MSAGAVVGTGTGDADTAAAEARAAVAAPGALTLPTVFSALGDETRWNILVRLGAGPASASALTKELPISRQAVARHLELLRAAGLVEPERHGRELRYRALGARLSEAARGLETLAQGWDARLASIKNAAENERGGP